MKQHQIKVIKNILALYTPDDKLNWEVQTEEIITLLPK